jgi:hypothetical protein
VFVRSVTQLDRARAAAKKAEVPFKVLDDNVETTSGHISIGTMHLAKGLEFRAVAVMACNDEVVPLQERIEWRSARDGGDERNREGRPVFPCHPGTISKSARARTMQLLPSLGSMNTVGANVTEVSLNEFPSRDIPDKNREHPYRFLICADK